ncbi:MAG: flagellar filament capping protein FliD [Lachnospiraceae bacterium]
MPIRLSGMVSGMDTDSMVQELVKASSTKKNNLVKAQTKLGWKQTAWKDLNTKIYGFFSKTLDNLRRESDYNKKKTTVADPTVATVVAGNGATKGTQTLAVKNLAKAGYLTGGKLSNDKKYSDSSTMENVGILAAGEKAKIKVSANGKETVIELTSDMKIGDLTKKMQKAGVDASFDSTNQRFFVSAKNSGIKGDFTITAQDSKGLSALSGLGLLTKEDIVSNPEYLEWSKLKGANDAETITNLTNAGKTAAEIAIREQQMKAENTTLTANNETGKQNIDKIKKAQTDYLAGDAYKNAMKAADATGTNTLDDNITLLKTKTETIKTEMNRYKELDAKKATTEGLTPQEQTEYDALGKKGTAGVWDTLPADEKNLVTLQDAKTFEPMIKEQQDQIAANQVKINYNNDRIGKPLLTDEVNADLVKKVEAAVEAIAKAGTIIQDATSPIRVLGDDAKIILNGAEFTSDSNTFTVNGLTITAQAVSTKDTTINTDTDTEGVYNQIKGFIKDYNKLMNEMDVSYNAASSKGYEPLTSEEKKEMSESEIKDWEEKIKKSLLKRDANLESVSSVMKSNMTASFTVNGKVLSLTDFGIETQSYFNAPENEKNAYHIAGDRDDAASSGEQDKLKIAIAANPEEVGKFFSKFADNLSTQMNQEMKRVTGYRTTYHAYDDVKMEADYKSYTAKIKEQEAKLTAMEDRYYKQFSAMETAMSKLNASQSSMNSLLGG